jgi:hypothetical protein
VLASAGDGAWREEQDGTWEWSHRPPGRDAHDRQGGRGALSAARGWSMGVRVEYLSWVCKTISMLGYSVVEYTWVKIHASPCLCKPIYTHGYQLF